MRTCLREDGWPLSPTQSPEFGNSKHSSHGYQSSLNSEYRVLYKGMGRGKGWGGSGIDVPCCLLNNQTPDAVIFPEFETVSYQIEIGIIFPGLYVS